MFPLLILGESNLSPATMAITKNAAQHAAKNIINGKSNQHIINKAFSSLKSAASPGLSAMLMCSATPRLISGRLEDRRKTHTNHLHPSAECWAMEKTYISETPFHFHIIS